MSTDIKDTETGYFPSSDTDMVSLRSMLSRSETTHDGPQNSSQSGSDLRPSSMADYVGQKTACDNLACSISATKRRGEAMDHVLFHGPPGLGKTSLSRVIATELGVAFKATSGPVLERPGDLAAILSSLEEKDVLFIDEIHRLSRVVEEILYPAMEDFHIDIIVGQGPAARSVQIELQAFTLVGATTRIGLLTSPLRNRFGIVERLEFYDVDELEAIIMRSAQILNVSIDTEGAKQIAVRSRGTPRIANRLLKRARDYAEEAANSVLDAKITSELANEALNRLDIDSRGLDRMDRTYMLTIIDKFGGGPVGIDTLAAAISEEKDTLEDVYEPFLLQQGFIIRTPRGREASKSAYEYFKRAYNRSESKNTSPQVSLFD